MKIKYKNSYIIVETIFSDYFISCENPNSDFYEFINLLQYSRVKFFNYF